MFKKQNKNNKGTAGNTELVKPRKSETSKKACLFTLAASIAVIPTLASANIANAAENQSLENQTKSVILADDKKATGNGVNDSHDGNKSTTQVNDTIRVFIQLAKNKDKNKKLDLTKLSNGDARFIGKYLSNFYAPYGTQIANADGQMPKEVEESMIKNLTETVGIQEADAKTLVTWVKAQLVQGSTELEWKFSKDGNATSGSGMLESPTIDGKKAVPANPYEFMKISSGAYGVGSPYLPYDVDRGAKARTGGNFNNTNGEGARTKQFNPGSWQCVKEKTGLSEDEAKNKYVDHEGAGDWLANHQSAFEDDNRGVLQHYGEERRTAWKIASCSVSYAVYSGAQEDQTKRVIGRADASEIKNSEDAKEKLKYSKDELNFYKKTLEEDENYAYLTDGNGHIAFKIDTTGESTTASVAALMTAAQLSNPENGYGNSFFDLLKGEFEKNKDNKEALSKSTILDSKMKMSPFGDLLYQSGNTTTVVIPAILNPYGFEAKDHKPGDVLPAANSFALAGTGYKAFSNVRNADTSLAQCVMGSGHINELRGKISGRFDGDKPVTSYRAVMGSDQIPWGSHWGSAGDGTVDGAAVNAMTQYSGDKYVQGGDVALGDGFRDENTDRHNYASRIPISKNNHDDGVWGSSNVFPSFWLGWHTRSLFDTYNRETTDCNGSVVVADLYKLYEGKDPKADLDEKSTFQVMHSLKDDGSMAIKQVPDFKEGTTFGIPKDGGGAYNLEGRAGLLDFNKVLDKNAAMTVYLTLLVQQHGKGTSLYDQLGMGSADSNLPPIKDDVKFDGLSEEQKQQNAKELENQIDNQLRWYMYYLMHPTKTKYKRELDKNSNIAYVSEAHANMIGANNQAGTTSASKFTGFVAYSAIPTTDDIKWTSGLKDMYFSQIHWVFAIILVVCLIYWIAGSLTLGQAIGSLIVLCFLFGTVTHVQDWAADKANGIVNNMYSSKFSYLGLVQEEAYADKIDEAAKGDSYNNYLQAQNEELQALEIDGENNPHTRGISNVTVKIQAPKKLQSLVVGGGKQDQELLDIAGNSQFGAVGLSAYTKSVSGQGFTENPNDTYLYRSYVDLSNFAKYTYLGVRPGSELVSGVEGHADTSKWTPSLRDAWNNRSQAWDQAVELGYNIPNKSGGVNSTKVVPALSSRIVTDAYASKESMGSLSLDQNVGIDTRRFNFGIVNYTKQHDFLSAVQKQTEANQTKKTNIKGRDKTVNAENAAPDKDKENKDNKDKKDDQKKQEEQQQQQQSSSGGGSSKPNPDAATLEGFQPDGGGKYTNLDYATLGAFAMYSESPFYYYYYNLADQGLNIDGGRGGYKDLLLGENSGGNYFYNTKGNGEMRDFNDSRELFTYVIPYLRQSNKSVNAFKELYGLHYHEGIPTTEGHWNDEGIRDDAVAQQKYWENLQTARLYGLYTPWVDLMETGRYAKETTIDVLGQKHTVKDPLDPASYPAERPMVFSRSEQLDNGLTDDQLTEVEKKIQEVQRNTAEKMLSLMNYYSFRDSTVDTAAALLTTFEFNKTFSERHWMDESLNLYPQSMDAKNISWDGYLRLILQTSEDGGGYDIGAEDFYDQIIRDQGVIFGWALVAVSALSGIGVPYLQWLVFFLLAVLSICRLVIILLRALPPLEVLKESGKHIGGPAIMMGLVFLIKNWLMSLMMSSGSTLVTGPLGNDGALVGMPVWGKIVLLLVIDLLSVGILVRLGFRIVGNIFGDIVTLKENFKGVLHDMKVNLSNARATGSFTGAISHIAGVRAERLEVAKQRSVPPPPNSVEGQMLRSASPLRRGGKNTARTTTAGGGDSVNYAAEASNRERRRGVTDSIKAAMAAGATGAVAGYGAGKKAVRVAKSAKRLTIGSVDKSKLNTTEKPVAQSKSDLQAAEERISNLATEKKKAENELLIAQQNANLQGTTEENQQAIRDAQNKVRNLNTEIGEANWRMNTIRRKVAEEERQINAEHKRKVGAEKGQQRKESRAEELKRVWRGIGKKSSNAKKDNT
jgi:hypothetical protein